MKNIAVICNPLPENGKSISVADSIARALKTKDISFSIFTTYWPQVWDQFSEAWIIGGDGTLNFFINQYPTFHLPMTIFKSGSGNDFSWALYGDVSLEQQMEKVLNGSVHKVDAGICNDRLFINGVGIGFDGAIVKELQGKKKQAGKTSYFLAVLKNILNYKESECCININDHTIKEDLFMVSVANGQRYGGGFKVAPNASVRDGLLDANIIGKIAPVKRLLYLPLIEKGEHLHLPFIQQHTCTEISITCQHSLPAHADGEYFEADSFEIKCLPKRFSFFL